MEHVLCLIGNPAGASLGETVVQQAHAALAAAGAETASTADWLDPGIACDLGFDGLAPATAVESVRQALADAPVDIVALPTRGRRKKLLVADMDSTIITVECIDELADFVGLKREVAAITERAMRGEIDFKAALRERAAMLAGMDEAVLHRVFEERVRLTPGARRLVMTMRADGAYTVLVSGGFSFFTSRVHQAAGFHRDHANILEVAGGKLTGRVVEPILDAGVKLATLRESAARRNLTLHETLAVGDGANDLPMIEAAGLGVAYRAKPKVAAGAAARIEHGDLTALLYLQGYRRRDFAG
ncbi:MAG TPA: phosphoserine phosphatase SerB [Candidatus Sulfotelmatobacter sp.]|nr:phosphoserine phosphatase SerB [Candidatus Sulfotelmatobacter sp.]